MPRRVSATAGRGQSTDPAPDAAVSLCLADIEIELVREWVLPSLHLGFDGRGDLHRDRHEKVIVLAMSLGECVEAVADAGLDVVWLAEDGFAGAYGRVDQAVLQFFRARKSMEELDRGDRRIDEARGGHKRAKFAVVGEAEEVRAVGDVRWRRRAHLSDRVDE